MSKTYFQPIVPVVPVFLLAAGIGQAGKDNRRAAVGTLRVPCHIDGADPAVAKYAMALINKHIEAEGGPGQIDIKVVVHGPALLLFDRKDADPERVSILKMAMDKGVQPEMRQVSMNAQADGFKPTEHPVAVKRIADLQEQGYLYIKP